MSGTGERDRAIVPAVLRRQMEAAERRLEAIERRVEDSSGAALDPSLPAAVQGLHDALEELCATEEELRSSQEDLFAANRRARAWAARYRTLFDSAPLAYVVTDGAGIIVEANDKAGELLGHRPHHLAGKPLEMFVAASHRHELRAALSRLDDGNLEEVHHWDAEMTPAAADAWRAVVRVRRLPDTEKEKPRVCWMLQDVTAQRQASAQLEEQLEFMDTVAENTEAIILVLDLEGRIVRFNPALEELCGYGLDEVAGEEWIDVFVPSEDRERIGETFKQTTEEVDTSGTVNAILTKAGSERRVVWSNALLRNRAGEPYAVLAIGHDVTELERARGALQESATLMRAVVDTALDGIITLDSRGVVKTFNPAAERIFGYAAEEVVGDNVGMLMPDEHAREHDGYIERYLETGEARIIGGVREVRGRRKDGSEFPIDLSVSEIVDASGRIAFAGILRDLSKRRELERHLADTATEERQYLANELHDSVSGQLTGIAIQASLLEQALGDDPEAERAADLAGYVEEAQDQLRRILRGLLPVEADELGLMAALRQLARDTEAMTRVSCEFTCEGPVPVEDRTVAAHLYRIAQEAVQNAVKHGDADRIVVTLAQAEELTLTVSDDGVGIGEEEPSSGMGLRTMRYRADLLGGDVDVAAREDGGTVVRCAVPLPSGA